MRDLATVDMEMLRLCVENPAVAWVTSPKSPNALRLREWCAKGWFEETTAPAEFLSAWRSTDAGRVALAALLRSKEEEPRE